MMLCLYQRITGGYLVAVFVGDNTANVPITATSIDGHDPEQLRTLIALSCPGIGQRCVYHFSLTVMIVPLIPRVGQLALTRCFYAEAGNVFLVIPLFVTGYISRFGVAGLNRNLYLGIFNITANSTDTVPVEGMLVLARQMRILTAISAVVPMVGGIPIPRRHRPFGMA